MNPLQSHTALSLVALAERPKGTPPYANAELDDDGRGWTLGVAGFTTGTGDALEVVTRYTRQKPDNPLAHYIKALGFAARDESGDVSLLHGIDAAWREAALDPLFWRVQDAVRYDEYLQPASALFAGAGLKFAITEAFLWDCAIQHGMGDDHDSLPKMWGRVRPRHKGTPELVSLTYLIEERRRVLLFAQDPETRKCWRAAVSRLEIWCALLRESNFDLHTPIVLNTKNFKETVN